MNKRPRPFWRSRSTATTLVEAVMGMALLGTLLTGSLVAQVRFNRQAAQARRVNDACRVADDLLESLWRQKDRQPWPDGGDVPDHPGWRWRIVDAPCDGNEKTLKDMRAKVVAVEVFQNGGDVPAAEPAARVELLMPSDDDKSSWRPR